MSGPIVTMLKRLRNMVRESIPFKFVRPRLIPTFEPTCNPNVSGACSSDRDLSVVV